MTPPPSLSPPTTSLCAVIAVSAQVGEIARRYVVEVLRLNALGSDVTAASSAVADDAVRALSGVGEITSVAVTIELGGSGVTLTVSGQGRAGDLSEWGASDVLIPGVTVTSGLSRQGDLFDHLWARVEGGAEPTAPVGGDNEPIEVLARVVAALSDAPSLAAVSDCVTAEVRARLGAAFTGVAVRDPLATGFIRFVSMDPLPPQTARGWAEVAISDASPLGAAAQGRPTHFASPSAAERDFPGIGEHMLVAGARSMSHIPLMWQGQLLGVLAVSWVDEYETSVAEQGLLAVVAACTAAAVHRCRPLADERVPVVEPTSTSTSTRPVRVLLVDDTPDIRELLTGLFARRPDVQIVAEAINGEQAIELAGALQPDIVVLDVAMPVLDGISALPRLTAAAPNARVVVLSALPAESRAPVALAAGATAYVEKSTAVVTLVDDLLAAAKLLDVAVRRLTVDTERQFAADPQQVGAARSFVRDTLQRWNESAVADTIVVLLSELVTNAIVHARSDPRVSVRLLPDRVHVDVTDQDSQVGQAQAPSTHRTSGRGLAIVESLAMGWGTASLPQGKVVWFDVARQPVR